ncbi:MAG TPA: hypothetical protein VE621_22570, partial [Bryobacteraceae bacterium]|nr:hypothetical protein [Bryobacteraceae bacterium]
MRPVWSRRALLGSLPLASFAAASDSPLRLFRDSATEFEIARYTEPSYNSVLPSQQLRIFSRGSFLLSSDRDGSWRPYLSDIRTGVTRAVWPAANYDPGTLTFGMGDRWLLCFEGDRLVTGALGASKTQSLYTIPSNTERTGFAVSALGEIVMATKAAGEGQLIFLKSTTKADPSVVRVGAPVDFVCFRPRQAGVAVLQAGRVNVLEGTKSFSVPAPPGRMSVPTWTQDGKGILYLLEPAEPRQLIQLREYRFDTSKDRMLAKTSQYATFARNADASVFAGISSNRASRHVLLLTRVARRELTICEHAASRAQMVQVFFTPNSQ